MEMEKYMNHYKLLTPGPLTTTDTVKQEMLFDHCTGTMTIKNNPGNQAKLLTLAGVSDKDYTAVPLCREAEPLAWNPCLPV